jgi:hypothetical protein
MDTYLSNVLLYIYYIIKPFLLCTNNIYNDLSNNVNVDVFVYAQLFQILVDYQNHPIRIYADT